MLTRDTTPVEVLQLGSEFKLAHLAHQIHRTYQMEAASTISITNKQVHAKTKHLDIKLFFLRYIKHKVVDLEYVPTQEQFADNFTKPLPRKQFRHISDQISFTAPKLEVHVREMATIFVTLIIVVGFAPVGNCFLSDEPHEIQPFEQSFAHRSPCNMFLDEPLLKELAIINQFEKDEIR